MSRTDQVIQEPAVATRIHRQDIYDPKDGHVQGTLCPTNYDSQDPAAVTGIQMQDMQDPTDGPAEGK